MFCGEFKFWSKLGIICPRFSHSLYVYFKPNKGLLVKMCKHQVVQGCSFINISVVIDSCNQCALCQLWRHHYFRNYVAAKFYISDETVGASVYSGSLYLGDCSFFVPFLNPYFPKGGYPTLIWWFCFKVYMNFGHHWSKTKRKPLI